MPRNPKYDQLQSMGHDEENPQSMGHNEENPQSMTKMPRSFKFDPFN